MLFTLVLAAAFGGVAIGAVAVLTAQTALRSLNPALTCTTCGTRSGHRVTGHTDRSCLDFVQERRRRTTAHAVATGAPAPALPDAYGNAWPHGQ